MKKNLYYQQVFRRRSIIKESVLHVFFALCSWPRLLLEVFIRRHFGERYFSFSTAVFLIILLSVFPFLGRGTSLFFAGYREFDFSGVLGDNISWYLYLAAFLYSSIQRRNEIKRSPSSFDFGRFSLSPGLHHPLLKELVYDKKAESPNYRKLEILVEPAIFFFMGVLLWLMDQNIGMLFIVCSVFYSLSYVAAYDIADNFILDKIDEILFNEELFSILVDGREPGQARGVRYYGRIPTDPETRRQLAESFIYDEDEEDIVEAR